MASTFLTNSIITYEALDILENTDNVLLKINAEYSDEFRFGGAVLGSTLNIRKPPRFLGRLGQAASVEAITETYVPLTLSYQRGVDTQVSSQDLKLNIDDYRKRILKPQIVRVCNLMDQDCCNLAQGLNQAVGTPGTVPSTLTTYLSAKTKLDNLAAPMEDRFCFLNPDSDSTLVDNLKGLFEASTAIAEQYREGIMRRTAGFNFAMDQNIYTHTVGTLGGTPTVTTAPANGATSIVTGSWTSTTLNAGDVVSFVSASTPVNAVNPQSYQSTGQVAQFVVTATVTDSGGAITIPVSPAIIYSGQLQNVSNQPPAAATVTVFGVAAASFSTISAKQSPQNLAVQRDFGTIACVDMPLPGGTDMANNAASKRAGMSIRVIRDYIASTDQWLQRLDVLYGTAVLRQELGVRVCA